MRPKEVRQAIEDALDSPEPVQPLFLWELLESASQRFQGKYAGKTNQSGDIRMSLLDPTDLRGILPWG